MSYLQSLAVGLRPEATLVALRSLRQLTKLELWGASAGQRRQLSALTGLRDLFDIGVNRDKDLSYLAPMAALTQLSLGLDDSGENHVDLAGMESLRSLEKLYLEVNQHMDLTPLSGLTSLHSLALSSTAIVRVQFMSSLQRLTELCLAATMILDPMHLSHLTALKDLYLECSGIAQVGWLSRLTNLHELSLFTPMLHDLAPLSGLVEWKALTLTGQMTSLRDLAGLDLQQLSLIECSQLASLSAMQHMTNL